MHNHQSAAIILAAVASERQPVGVRIHSARPHGHAPHARTPRAPRTPCTLICERSSGTVCGFASRCRASRASSDYSQLASPGPFEGARALVGLVERASRFIHGSRPGSRCTACAPRSAAVAVAPTALRAARASQPPRRHAVLAPASPTPTWCRRSSGVVCLRLLVGAEAVARKLECARWRAGALACLALLM